MNFKDWLHLDLRGITWENKFLDDFEVFWEHVFEEELSFSDHLKRIHSIKRLISKGPVLSWVSWIEENYLIYQFETTELSLNELAEQAELRLQDLASIMRTHYGQLYPQHRDLLSENLLIVRAQDSLSELNFDELKKRLRLDSMGEEAISSTIRNIEVTLLDDWKVIMANIKLGDQVKEDTPTLVKKNHFQFRKFAFELAILFVIGGALVVSLRSGSHWYENYLSKKITLFEPYFFWIDEDLSFKTTDNSKAKFESKLSYEELEKLEKLENKLNVEEQDETQRFDVESDVVITSLSDQLKNFDFAESEESSYEEKRKGGYRNFSYGRRKAYRVMMTSVDPRKVKKEVKEMLNKYNVRKVDKVDPGKEIPGGVYFNLYVPKKEVKDFLAQVNGIEETTILESKTVIGGPRGMSKVFIWIKSI